MPWPKGKPRSEETKTKISHTLIGHPPYNTKSPSKETREKISLRLMGIKRSDETRMKMSESKKGAKHPMYGKNLPNKTKQKMSASRQGEKHPFYGKNHTEKTKIKISKSKQGQTPWNKGKTGIYTKETLEHWSLLRQGIKRSNKTKQKMRKARLRQIFPVKDTSIEVALQKELDARDIEYSKHLPVCGICQPDIVFPSKKTAVFADGDYWHSKEFDNGRAWKKDRFQDKTLAGNGWVALRFWEHEIQEDVEKCVDKIIKTLEVN